MKSIYQKVVVLLILLVTLAVFGLNAPLKTGFVIGGDDHFELQKAQLLHRNPGLASDLHNDQPWLNTILIARLFSVFGENAAVPRIFTLSLIFAMVLAVWYLIGNGASFLVYVLFLAFFFTSSEVPELVTSAMLEPSAMAFSVLAVACSWSSEGKTPLWRLYLSGLLFSIAVFSKLTALIIVPAWFSLLWIGRTRNPICVVFLRIILSFTIGSMVFIAISPTFSLDAIFLSHYRAHNVLVNEHLNRLSFDFGYVFPEWSILLGIAFGISLLFRQKTCYQPSLLFASVWLITDFGIHLWHRPWWGYYSIHFHIPVAILAACGAGFVIEKAWRSIRPYDIHWERDVVFFGRVISSSTRYGAYAIVAATLISCFFGFRLPQLWKELVWIRVVDNSDDDHFTKVIRQFSGRAHWIYANNGERVFHGGVMQAPELVLLTFKRTVNEDLNQNAIFEIVQRYRPELLLLSQCGEMQDPRFQKWLADGKFVNIMWDGNYSLWASPILKPTPARKPHELIKALRL